MPFFKSNYMRILAKATFSHIAIKDRPSDVQFDDARYYQLPLEKQGTCEVCKKNSRHSCIKCKINLHNV